MLRQFEARLRNFTLSANDGVSSAARVILASTFGGLLGLVFGTDGPVLLGGFSLQLAAWAFFLGYSLETVLKTLDALIDGVVGRLKPAASRRRRCRCAPAPRPDRLRPWWRGAPAVVGTSPRDNSPGGIRVDYSHIIVGGGSAGSVLANRLSARSANRVLLLEAGQDTPPGQVPKAIEDTYPGTAYFDPRFHWTELKVRTQVVSHNNPDAAPPPLRKYEQARVLGGGSSINGQMANRGAPTDFDEWEARGAAGWNWDSVLPYFKKVERDLDFDGRVARQGGPHPVTRIPAERWCDHAKAAARGLPGWPASSTCPTRTASSRTATSPSPSRSTARSGSRPRSAT